jgi:WD40 repeat protein/tRNA A-37 threonylcarbamoyl transferase component Bud32
MSGNPDARQQAWLEHERVIDCFEAAWQEHGTANIRDFLPPSEDPRRAALLCEIISVDLEYRWDHGQAPRVEDYVRDFPELAQPVIPLRLIAEEIRIRRFHGCAPSSAELEQRFRGRSAELGSLDLPPTQPGNAPSDSTAPAAPAMFSGDPLAELPARRLGRYELRERLGQGSFATVYRAWDPELHREVALKVPRPEYQGQPELDARVLREARSAARLRHPGIVPIHEAGTVGKCTYIAYDFIPGPTLAALLRRGMPSPRQAAEWAARVADALDYAHRSGIVHRDVKPANIMMDRDGQPVLADFGLAIQADAAATLTQHGDVLGTPAYMSPEQARGRGHEVDARTDVYSLGVVLYEMLSGHLPFEGQGASILHRVIHEEPPPPARHRSAIPADLETVCLKALAKEPSRRYSSAAALAEDLRRYLDHLPVRARRLGPLGRLGLWCRRNPALAATMTAAAAAIIVVASVGFVQVVHERDRYRSERDRAEANLYRALLGEARAQLRARDTGWWWQALGNIQKAARLAVSPGNVSELRDLAIQCMGTEYPCLRVHSEWTAHASPITGLAVSPDGGLAATAAQDCLAIWNLPEGKQAAVFSGHGTPITCVDFHPDGVRLAVAFDDGSVRLWEFQNREQPGSADGSSRLIESLAGTVSAIKFSPDGAWLAVTRRDGAVRLLPIPAAGLGCAACAARPRIFGGQTAEVNCLSFSPDGARLASGSDDRIIRLWDVAAGRLTASWSASNAPIALAFTPDGNTVAWSDFETFGVRMRRLSGTTTTMQAQMHTGTVHSLGFDRKHRLWTASADGSAKLWRPYYGTEFLRETATAGGDFAGVTAAVMTRDDRWLVAGYGDGRVRVWEVAEPPQRALLESNNQNAIFMAAGRRLVTGQFLYDFSNGLEAAPVVYPPSEIRSLVLHPAGAWLAHGHDDGSIHVWDFAQGRERSHWRAHRGGLRSLAASGDGQFLASASSDGSVKVWRWDSGRLERSLDGTIGAIHQVSWSRDGRHVAACGELGVLLWDWPNGKARVLSEEVQRSGATAFGNDFLAFASQQTVEVWNLRLGRRAYTLHGHASPVLALDFSSDGQQLATAADDGVRLWDTGSGREQASLRVDGLAPRWLAFEPGGRWLLIGRTSEPLIWDVAAKKVVARMASLARPFQCGAFSPDGAHFYLAAGVAGTLLRYSVAEVKQVAGGAHMNGGDLRIPPPSAPIIPAGHSDSIWGVATSPDGRWLATAGHDRAVRLWDGRTLQLVRTLDNFDDLVWCVAFSPDSRYLASGGADLRVCEAATGKAVWRSADHERMVSTVAFHPGGRWLISGSYDGTVRLWDASSGRSRGILGRLQGPVHKVAFRPDGRRLAVAGHDHHVSIWNFGDRSDAAPGPPAQRLAAHAGPVYAVGWSPDGRYLASGSNEGIIKLWDGDSFTLAATLQAGTGQIRSVSFSSDGRLLAGAAYVAPAVVWDLSALHRSLAEMGLDW